ncbi:MAG: SAM-dependent methyltransferase [Rhodospirillaceae bacterium]|nr:SAM-dependent methyltransferase [Rhodospirillaceae bacterium]MBI77188.1 SAM-dependent methyltransferase [Rhodospirillaceae bacterium]|tara:strand:+ start:1956 stop:2573 length:618 start_codon:yes stop_codon:yes gene_type:complete
MFSKKGTGSWPKYYEKTGKRPPRETLLFALNEFEKYNLKGKNTPLAIDLGCGNGRDTVEMLRRGWRVLAIDAEPSAIEGINARINEEKKTLLETKICRFEGVLLPKSQLINSSFALPLVSPIDFPALWKKILDALMPRGLVSCQLYGERDSWVGDPTITFFSRSDIDALLSPLQLEYFREEEEDSTTPRGIQKHWHIYHIVARRS